MSTETFSIFIDATSEQIFPFVGDLPRHSEWATDRLEFESLTTRPICVGSEYRSTSHFMGTIITAALKVKDYLPPERFSFTVEDLTGQYAHIFTLRPQAGGTLVIKEVHSADPPISRILHAILLPILIKPEGNKALQKLKDKVEHEYQKSGSQTNRVRTVRSR